jgi:hypothetical protein
MERQGEPSDPTTNLPSVMERGTFLSVALKKVWQCHWGVLKPKAPIRGVPCFPGMGPPQHSPRLFTGDSNPDLVSNTVTHYRAEQQVVRGPLITFSELLHPHWGKQKLSKFQIGLWLSRYDHRIT